MTTAATITYRLGVACSEGYHGECEWRTTYFTCTCPCARHMEAWRKRLHQVDRELFNARALRSNAPAHRLADIDAHIARVQARHEELSDEARKAGYQGAYLAMRRQ